MERNSFLKKTYWYETNYGTPFQNAVFISPSKHVQKKNNKIEAISLEHICILNIIQFFSFSISEENRLKLMQFCPDKPDIYAIK